MGFYIFLLLSFYFIYYILLMMEIFHPVIDWYMANINYWTVWLLMMVESSFIPFPSEVIIPPAWWKAAQWLLNTWLVLLFAGIGALLGALINYYIAYFLGRRIIYKLANTSWAHMIFIKKESIEKSEEYFRKHGKISTFVGRLIPAVRQLISIPAWLAKMDLWHFMFYTFLGASIWNIVLFVVGYVLWKNWEMVMEYNHIFKQIIIWIIVLVVLFFVVRYFIKKRKNKWK